MSGGSISNLVTYNMNSNYRLMPQTFDTDNFSVSLQLPSEAYDHCTHVSITNVNIPKSWYVV